MPAPNENVTPSRSALMKLLFRSWDYRHPRVFVGVRFAAGIWLVFAARTQGYFATHLGNDVSPALIDNELRRCLSASPVATIEVWRAGFHSDHRAELRAITFPVLIINSSTAQPTSPRPST